MTRIKDLTALTSLATNDEFAVEDTSANATRKITWANMLTTITFTPLSLASVGSSTWFADTFAPSYDGFSIGDGVEEWYYWRIGSLVWFWGYIEWGSTSAGTGDFKFTLPVMSSVYADEKSKLGDLTLTDATDNYEGSVLWGTGSYGVMKIKQVSGANVVLENVNDGMPVTLAAGDIITVSGMYRA